MLILKSSGDLLILKKGNALRQREKHLGAQVKQKATGSFALGIIELGGLAMYSVRIE